MEEFKIGDTVTTYKEGYAGHLHPEIGFQFKVIKIDLNEIPCLYYGNHDAVEAHQRIESSPNWARENGFTKSRL